MHDRMAASSYGTAVSVPVHDQRVRLAATHVGVPATKGANDGPLSCPQPPRNGTSPPSHPPGPVRQRRRHRAGGQWGRWFAVTALLAWTNPITSAAWVHFDNCLDRGIVYSNPVQLQFVPLNVSARLNSTDASHNLNVTIYGNVTGSATTLPPPPPDDLRWGLDNETLGKIVDLSPSNFKYSTLFARFAVLSYTPYQHDPSRFCDSLVQGRCPLAPVFHSNA